MIQTFIQILSIKNTEIWLVIVTPDHTRSKAKSQIFPFLYAFGI